MPAREIRFFYRPCAATQAGVAAAVALPLQPPHPKRRLLYSDDINIAIATSLMRCLDQFSCVSFLTAFGRSCG